MTRSAARLSIVLPTDTYETIETVLQRLRQQTIVRQIEIVLVLPIAQTANPRKSEDVFAAVRIVEVKSLSPLGRARALGVQAATAPLIFIGETHSYLQSDAAEKLITAVESESWALVAPGFENANPQTVVSWASFLGDYGRWCANMPAGEISDAPLYNALYRRDVLVSMGDRLEQMLSHGDELRDALVAGGHRAYFEPAARIDHVNLDSFSASGHEQFLAGRLIGSQRAKRWSWLKRLGYALGACLIPFVLTWRVWPGLRRTARVRPVPAATFPTILLLNFAKATGELMSYVFGPNSKQAAQMDQYEIHKLDYLA